MNPEPTLPIGSEFGPYKLLKLLGVGGMAEIYLARSKGLSGFDMQLVLKIILPHFAGDHNFIDMIVTEAKLTVGLNHPNIVQTFDLGQIDNKYFISMEYIDGADFFKILTSLTQMNRDMPIEATLFIAQEVLAGLEYAHNKTNAQGNPLYIIHRDISPQNILLSREGEVKLVDFGIAKAANATNKTKAGVIKGKLVYMSPEQAWGETLDQRADLFSTGVVVYEAITGGSLYLEPNPALLLEKVRYAKIPPPSTIRSQIIPELDTVVMKALKPNPADRYQTAFEFAEAISELLQKIAPGFSGSDLGDLVDSVLDDVEIPPQPEVMNRNDFGASEHSLVFAPDHIQKLAIPDFPQALGAKLSENSDANIMVNLPGASLLLLGNTSTAEYPLACKEFFIGRTGHLRLTDGRISRRHARILFAQSKYTLEDLGSSNGTFLNENKINGPMDLREGDLIRIGPFKMRFVYRQPAAPLLADALESTVKGERRGNTPQTESQKHVESSQPLSAKAFLVAQLENEKITLPVNTPFQLNFSFGVGTIQTQCSAGILVQRLDGYWLEPQPSKEELHLNGHPVLEPLQLFNGDQVTVGPIQLEFLLR
ncbi:MAG: FHA domain-containing serine/threonine-protein kinase [Pseudomonadota bacterium]